MYHYVYRISNVKLDKHYYGKRSSKIPPKQDLGIKYFSSSSDKEFMLDQITNPQNYKYKIISQYKTSRDALAKEIKLHNKLNVGSNSKFYNKAKQTATGFDTTGSTLTEEHKRKVSPLGRKFSEETKDKIRKKSYKEYLTEEARYKMGSANRGKHLSEETKSKLSKAKIGTKHTEKAKRKMSEQRQGIKNPRAKLIDVYDYKTGKLLAEKIVASIWCKDKDYNSPSLLQTLKRDLSKPYSGRNNPWHYKGIYAVLSK